MNNWHNTLVGTRGNNRKEKFKQNIVTLLKDGQWHKSGDLMTAMGLSRNYMSTMLGNNRCPSSKIRLGLKDLIEEGIIEIKKIPFGKRFRYMTRLIIPSTIIQSPFSIIQPQATMQNALETFLKAINSNLRKDLEKEFAAKDNEILGLKTEIENLKRQLVAAQTNKEKNLVERIFNFKHV